MLDGIVTAKTKIGGIFLQSYLTDSLLSCHDAIVYVQVGLRSGCGSRLSLISNWTRQESKMRNSGLFVGLSFDWGACLPHPRWLIRRFQNMPNMAKMPNMAMPTTQ